MNKEPELEIKIKNRESFNWFMISKFSGLKNMYQCAIAEAIEEKEIALYKGWQEWHRLDEESKEFVRDYMKQ